MGRSQAGVFVDQRELAVPRDIDSHQIQTKARDILSIKVGDTQSNQSVLERETDRERESWHRTPCPISFRSSRQGGQELEARAFRAAWPGGSGGRSLSPQAQCTVAWVLVGSGSLLIYCSLQVLTRVGLESGTSELTEEAAGCEF